MKAALTYSIGRKKYFLDVMELDELDDMCIKEFYELSDILDSEKYSEAVKNARSENDNADGNLGVFLLNEDGTIVINQNERGQTYEQRVKLLLGNNNNEGVRKILFKYYYNHPDELRTLLKRIYMKVRNYSLYERASIDFVSTNHFSLLQYDMFGDNKSLFKDKDIHIKDVEGYKSDLGNFIWSLNFSKLPDIYSSCRRIVFNYLEEEKEKFRIMNDPSIDEFEITRLMLFGVNPTLPRDKQDAVVRSYLAFQEEAKVMKEIDELNDKKFSKTKKDGSN